MSEMNQQTAETASQAEVKYPIVLHQNTSINAKPPYKVLRFANGDFIQLIDMYSRRFSDASVGKGAYSIALFKITEEETALIEICPQKLDALAGMLYAHVPADRFIRASVVKENKPFDIKVTPGCASLNDVPAPVEAPAPKAVTVDGWTPAEQKIDPFAHDAVPAKPQQDIGEIHLNIVPDVLNDQQREQYVFAPIRFAHRLTAEETAGLDITELLSAAFVTSKSNVSRMPQFNKDAKDANFKLLLTVIAEWLKNNPFYMVYDRTEEAPVKLFNNGVPFTPLFTSSTRAERVIFGNDKLECVEVSVNKADFFRLLLDRGIVQFIVDGNPLTLSSQGYYNFMSNS